MKFVYKKAVVSLVVLLAMASCSRNASYFPKETVERFSVTEAVRETSDKEVKSVPEQVLPESPTTETESDLAAAHLLKSNPDVHSSREAGTVRSGKRPFQVRQVARMLTKEGKQQKESAGAERKPSKDQKGILGLLGFILGGLSLVLLPFGLAAAIFLALPGFILSLLGLRGRYRVLAIIGLVLSSIGLLLMTAGLLLVAAFLSGGR